MAAAMHAMTLGLVERLLRRAHPACPLTRSFVTTGGCY